MTHGASWFENIGRMRFKIPFRSVFRFGVAVSAAQALTLFAGPSEGAPAGPPPGWEAAAPRDEIRPAFSFDPKGGPDANGGFAIRSDAGEGLDGYWTKTFRVQGGQHYLIGVRRIVV